MRTSDVFLRSQIIFKIARVSYIFARYIINNNKLYGALKSDKFTAICIYETVVFNVFKRS